MKTKTYKRETAWFALSAYWGAVLTVGAGWAHEATTLAEILNAAVWPVHGLAAGMFGIHWFSEQGPGK